MNIANSFANNALIRCHCQVYVIHNEVILKISDIVDRGDRQEGSDRKRCQRIKKATQNSLY